jgi:hypothetical protein
MSNLRKVLFCSYLLALAANFSTCARAASAADPAPADYAADARALDDVIAANYAYLDRFPGSKPPRSPALDAMRDAVQDGDTLLHYAEASIQSLADHHAITGASFDDSWGLVPSYSDLWIEPAGSSFRIEAVRAASPAERAGIRPGDVLVAVNDKPLVQALADFWAPLGLDAVGERAAYGARVLATGRRDRPRMLTIRRDGTDRRLTLPNLYGEHSESEPVTSRAEGKRIVLRINNSLGDSATIAAFDAAMARLPSDAALTIDLSDTPSGGSTVIARAMMGWFVRRPTSYQLHNYPAERLETGIGRQWIEQVLPRDGKYHPGPVNVRVGRWTGSMGEGLAIGFATMGKRVCGTKMARLRGAIYDFELPATKMMVKLPAERLYTVAGQPRETFVPLPESACR